MIETIEIITEIKTIFLIAMIWYDRCEHDDNNNSIYKPGRVVSSARDSLTAFKAPRQKGRMMYTGVACLCCISLSDESINNCWDFCLKGRFVCHFIADKSNWLVNSVNCDYILICWRVRRKLIPRTETERLFISTFSPISFWLTWEFE